MSFNERLLVFIGRKTERKSVAVHVADKDIALNLGRWGGKGVRRRRLALQAYLDPWRV